MNKTKQDMLREQLEERRENAKKVWKIYRDEIMRLIGNPDEQPDVSRLERFIKNSSDTFSIELAKLFKDAIEFGFIHADFISELEGERNAETQ